MTSIEILKGFTWAVGNGIDMTLPWSESSEWLLSFFAPPSLTGDFTGLRLLRAATSAAPWAVAGDASESAEWLRDLFFCRSSSSDEVDLSWLLRLPAGLLLRLEAVDDDEELRDELLEADLFLFSSSGDFSDLQPTPLISPRSRSQGISRTKKISRAGKKSCLHHRSTMNILTT